MKDLLSAASAQEVWNSCIRPSHRPVAGSVRAVVLSTLLDSLGIGGSRWIRQFIYGFDLVGSFSQASASPRDCKESPPLGPWIFGGDRAFRFLARVGLGISARPSFMGRIDGSGGPRLARGPPPLRCGRAPLAIGLRRR